MHAEGAWLPLLSVPGSPQMSPELVFIETRYVFHSVIAIAMKELRVQEPVFWDGFKHFVSWSVGFLLTETSLSHHDFVFNCVCMEGISLAPGACAAAYFDIGTA